MNFQRAITPFKPYPPLYKTTYPFPKVGCFSIIDSLVFAHSYLSLSIQIIRKQPASIFNGGQTTFCCFAHLICHINTVLINYRNYTLSA